MVNHPNRSKGAKALAAQRVLDYINKRTAQPLRSIGDSVHSIHIGTEWEAELLFSDLQKLRSVLIGAANRDIAPLPPSSGNGG